MWSVACVRCGASAEVSLAPPRLVRCAACGGVEPAAPELEARLSHAADILMRVAGRTQRLHGLSRSIVTLGRRATLVFFAAPWAAAVLMTALLAAVQLYGVAVGEGASVGRMCVLVPLSGLLFVLGGAALRGLWTRLDALLALCAADPPAAAGEPLRCPVCGGGVDVRGVRAIATCGYCASDVVVESEAVAKAAGRHASQLDALESTLHERSGALARASVGRAVALFAFAVVASFGLAVCGGFVGAMVDIGRIVTRGH